MDDKIIAIGVWNKTMEEPPPKDGTTILAWFFDSSYIGLVGWDENHQCWEVKGRRLPIIDEPISWAQVHRGQLEN